MEKNYLISTEKISKISNFKRWILFISIFYMINSILNFVESNQSLQLFNNTYYLRALNLFFRVTLAGVLIHDIAPKFKTAIASMYFLLVTYIFYGYTLINDGPAIIKYGLFIIFIAYSFWVRVKIIGIYNNQIKYQ